MATEGKADVADQKKLATTQDALAKEKSQFFSDKQRAIVWWVVGGGVVLAVVLGVLSAFAGSNPAVSVVYHGILGVVTGGLSWIHSLVGKLTAGKKAG